MLGKGRKAFSKRERGGEFDRQKEPMLSTQVMLDTLGGATAYVYETTYLKMHYPMRLKVRFRGSSPPYQNGRVPCHVTAWEHYGLHCCMFLHLNAVRGLVLLSLVLSCFLRRVSSLVLLYSLHRAISLFSTWMLQIVSTYVYSFNRVVDGKKYKVELITTAASK